MCLCVQNKDMVAQKGNILPILLIVIVLGLVGGGGYYFFLMPKPAEVALPPAVNISVKTTPKPTAKTSTSSGNVSSPSAYENPFASATPSSSDYSNPFDGLQ